MHPEKTALKIEFPADGDALVNGRRVALTFKERKLLILLFANAGNCVTRQELFEEIWGYDGTVKTRTLDVHVRRLRMKVGSAVLIETVFGISYRFNPNGSSGTPAPPRGNDNTPLPPAAASAMPPAHAASTATVGAAVGA
jgi:DNA-binding winged helix-turn-helix (wHTH) protein